MKSKTCSRTLLLFEILVPLSLLGYSAGQAFNELLLVRQGWTTQTADESTLYSRRTILLQDSLFHDDRGLSNDAP